MLHYSKKLNKHFTVKDDGSCVFEDETHYSRKEIDMIKGSTDFQVKIVHGLKKYFLGEVLS